MPHMSQIWMNASLLPPPSLFSLSSAPLAGIEGHGSLASRFSSSPKTPLDVVAAVVFLRFLRSLRSFFSALLFEEEGSAAAARGLPRMTWEAIQ